MASRLQFITQPGGARTGVAFTAQPVIEARNVDGTLDTGFTGLVTLAVDAGVGVLSGTAAVNAVAGVATFAGLVITGIGKHVLVATAAGLTSGYSGVMSVMRAAAVAGTHLDYTGSSSARYLDAGSAVAIPVSTTIVSVFRPHSNATGGARLYQRNAPVAADRIVWAISPSGTLVYIRTRSTQDALFVSTTGWFSTETVVKAAVTHDGVGGAGQFFAGVVGAGPLSAVTLATNQPGSGTLDSPTSSPARMWGGDVGADSVGYGTMLFDRVLTKEECDQAVALIMDQSRDYTARPVPISGCIGFWQDGRDGTATVVDRSGAGHNGTVIGAPASVGGVVLHAPQVWAHSTDPVDQGDYWQPTSHAAWSVTTDATQMEVHLYRTLAGFNPQNALAVLVNGTYNTQVVVAAAGPHTATVTLPAGAGKLVTLVNGVQSRAGAAGVGDPEISVGLISAFFNAAATEVIPATPSLHAVSLHDSIFDGFVADPVGQRGVIEQLRTLLPGYGVTSIGYGGHTLFKVATNIAARDALVAVVRSIRPQVLLLHLGLNDYSNALWNATNYGTAYEDLLARLITAMPSLRVQLVTPVTLATGEGANGLGSTVPDYRAAATTAASTHSEVLVWDGPTDVWDGTNLGDTVHPNNLGSDGIAANLAAIIPATGTTVVEADANSAGTATATGIAAATVGSVAGAAGISTVGGQAAAVVASTCDSAGTSTALGEGAAVVASEADASGVSTASGESAAVVGSVASAESASIASVIGAAIVASEAEAAGVSAGPGVAAAIGAAQFDAGGTSTALGVSGAIASADAITQGTSTVSGVGEDAAATGSNANASGTSAAVGIAAVVVASVASSTSTSTAPGEATAVVAATAAVSGTTTVSAESAAIAASLASVAGLATVSGISGGIAGSVGASAGMAIVLGVGEDATIPVATTIVPAPRRATLTAVAHRATLTSVPHRAEVSI